MTRNPIVIFKIKNSFLIMHALAYSWLMGCCY